jgi:hypothetical protein
VIQDDHAARHGVLVDQVRQAIVIHPNDIEGLDTEGEATVVTQSLG